MIPARADVVILGSGIAAQTAAETLRRYAPEMSIVMISREPGCLRPLLTKARFERIGSPDLDCLDSSWLEAQSVVFVSADITALCPQEHLVRTSAGTIGYGRCIYALGSDAFVPPIPGSTLEGVCPIRTLAHMRTIKRRLPDVRQAVVIGGGVIGLEAGQMPASYGVETTILEALPYLMPRVLDPETAEEYRKRLDNCRVETGVNVRCITGDTEVTGVALADGRQFPCQLVIVSCGVRSNIRIAREAGLDVDRGVVVRQDMCTSDPDVYACGDCAQYNGQCSALWKPAMEQGRVAAMEICGKQASFHPQSFPVMFYAPGASLFAAGNLAISPSESLRVVTTRSAADQSMLVNPRKNRAYSRLVYEGDRLVGAALIGDLSSMSAIQKLLAQGGI